MNSTKRPAERRRTPIPRTSDHAKSFQKDWDRLSRSGRYDMARLKAVMLLLVAHDAPLGPEWRDHPLQGEWKDHRELHIGGDFLLIYQASEDAVVFVRAGTHAELFD